MGGDNVSMMVPNEAYNVFEIIEDVLKDWELYQLIVKDMSKYPGIERYNQVAHIMKCIEDRKEYMTRKECRYLELKYFKRKSYDQIAKSLGISERSVARWRIKVLLKIAKRGALL